MRKNVGKSSMVVIPTEKTNSFRTIELEKYIKWVKGHLKKPANISSRYKIVEIYKKAKEILDIKLNRILSEFEINNAELVDSMPFKLEFNAISHCVPLYLTWKYLL